MLLAYVQDLLESDKSFEYTSQVYETVIDGWIGRERVSLNEKDLLRRFCEHLAVYLCIKRQEQGVAHIQGDELNSLAQKWHIDVDECKLRSRSLLNRDHFGNYRFADPSIMEYLFVRRFMSGDRQCRGIRWTDQMKIFFLESSFEEFKRQRKLPLHFHAADLAHLKGLRYAPLYRLRSSPKWVWTSGGYGCASREKVQGAISMIRKYDFFDSQFNNHNNHILHIYRPVGGIIVADYAYRLMWQQSGSLEKLNINKAKEYVMILNDNALGGYNDWRLPTLEEAMCLLEPSKGYSLHINPVFDAKQEIIWTSDKYRYARATCIDRRPVKSLVVDFKDGTFGFGHYHQILGTPLSKVHVRAVRSINDRHQ